MENKLENLDVHECIDQASVRRNMSVQEYKNWCENIECEPGYSGQSVYPPRGVDREDSRGSIKITVGGKSFEKQLMLSTNEDKVKLNASELRTYGEPPVGWYVSEKYDGIRGIWDGRRFVSRAGKVFSYVPRWFQAIMPPNVALDGEIWLAREAESKISSISNMKPGSKRSRENIEAIWAGQSSEAEYSDLGPVNFKIFDIVQDHETNLRGIPYEERFAIAQRIVRERCKCWPSIVKSSLWPFQRANTCCPISTVNSELVTNAEDLVNFKNSLIAQGAEGIVLRAPGSLYETKRSKLSIKMKKSADGECKVLGYEAGTGRISGLVGAIQCQLCENGRLTGTRFNIGTGFDDSQRDPDWMETNIPIGSILTFSYMNLTSDGVPRHPVFKMPRHDYECTELQSLAPDESVFQWSDDLQGYPINDIIIEAFETMKIEAENDPDLAPMGRWGKIKGYNAAIASIARYDDPIRTTSQACKLFRDTYKESSGQIGLALKTEKNCLTGPEEGPWKSKILQKIREILATGALSAAERIRTDPRLTALRKLETIHGIGRAKAQELWSQGIASPEELRAALKDNPCLINPHQKIGLRYARDLSAKIPRSEMEQWEHLLKSVLSEVSSKAYGEVLGSYRRGVSESGDVDFFITGPKTDAAGAKLLTAFIQALEDKGVIEETFSHGKKKFMGVGQLDSTFRHLDIFFVSPAKFPFAMVHWTGSKDFNVYLRNRALRRGWSLSDQGVKQHSANGKAATAAQIRAAIGKDSIESEEDLFNFLGIQYIAPEDRIRGAHLISTLINVTAK